MDTLITQLKVSRKVTEHLKARSQARWLQEMKNISLTSEEIVKVEIIFN